MISIYKTIYERNSKQWLLNTNMNNEVETDLTFLTNFTVGLDSLRE